MPTVPNLRSARYYKITLAGLPIWPGTADHLAAHICRRAFPQARVSEPVAPAAAVRQDALAPAVARDVQQAVGQRGELQQVEAEQVSLPQVEEPQDVAGR